MHAVARCGAHGGGTTGHGEAKNASVSAKTARNHGASRWTTVRMIRRQDASRHGCMPWRGVVVEHRCESQYHHTHFTDANDRLVVRRVKECDMTHMTGLGYAV
jgi:hypothetical protein